nr:glycosyltransferase [Candidatus Njordarchaeum guaymaensis]
MKVVMVNDCAFIGETLLKFLPSGVGKQHIQRGRGSWGKTLGLAHKILRCRGSIYHVHYLLQDCYFASMLRKRPLVGHAHGSDLRASLQHPIWGPIVRHNLKHCDKIVVSTPDILGIARRFRKDAQYLPGPVDAKLFYHRPLRTQKGKKRVLIAGGSNWNLKGTDEAVRALAKFKGDVDVSIIEYGADLEKTLALAKSLDLHLSRLPRVPHEMLNKYYWDADIVIDQFKLGAFGLTSLEAIACGRPAVTYVSSEFREYKDFPLKNVNTISKIVDAIRNSSRELWKEEYGYVEKYHMPEKVLEKVKEIYAELLSH